jgi:hypothetical protein
VSSTEDLEHLVAEGDAGAIIELAKGDAEAAELLTAHSGESRRGEAPE